jgi:LysR family transcriptional regulator, low CO2-responsive transcriptional regulator
MPALASSLELRLTLHQLRIFKTVVEQRNFTRAAEQLSLTQPAVTHQMQTLARALGQPLLQPGRVFELTPVGRAVYERAGRVLALVRETGEAIDELVGLRRGAVRVAGDTTVSVYVLPDAIAAFHREYPDIELSLEVVRRDGVRDLLLRGEVDLGILSVYGDDPLLAVEPLLESEFLCFCAPTHPLAGRSGLEPRDLAGAPLLVREPGSGTREATDEVLNRAGIRPDLEMANNGALKRTVAGGLGVTIVSVHAVQLELTLGLLKMLEVEGFPIRRTWHVAWAAERLLSPAAQAFLAFLRGAGWRQSLALSLGVE